MSVLPASREELVAFFEAHQAGWVTNSVAIGLTPAQVTALGLLIIDARKDVNAITSTKLAARAATITANTSAATLRAAGQQAIDRIRIQAEATHNPNVYSLAQIPPPAPPGPTPPPETPARINADPNPDGTVTIKWKGSTSSGAFFTIWRRVGEDGTWSHITSMAGRSRSFIDTLVPSPVTTEGAALYYTVFSQRGSETSAPGDPAIIQYGSGPGFAATAMKMAA